MFPLDDPTSMTNKIQATFPAVKILFTNDDSLTPIVNKPVIIIASPNAKKSGYGAK